MYAEPDRTCRICNTFGMKPSPSLYSQSLSETLAEMNLAGITLGVIPVRRGTATTDVPNAEVAAFVRDHRGLFTGIASPNPERLDEAPAEVEELMNQSEFSGIVLEPGLWEPALYLSDRRLYPVYERCQELGVFVLLMAGGSAGPDITYTIPEHLDRVSADFPRLTIVAAHGGWPWVNQALHIAWRRPNVYLSPDMYLFGQAGWRDYVDAGNGFLQDRFLFGTSFPFVPLLEAVKRFKALFRPEVLPKLMAGNAMRILNMTARLGSPETLKGGPEE